MREVTSESPEVVLDGDYLFGGKSNIFIDTGADNNVIKSTVLRADATVHTDQMSYITGILLTKVYTLGTVELEILENTKLFHVVKPTLPISAEGILGRPFLRKERSNISFFYIAMITASRLVDYTIYRFRVDVISKGIRKIN